MSEMKFCQSCSMPLTKAEDFGTNADGSRNEDYCLYCFKDGHFVDEDITMEQEIEFCAGFCVKEGVYPSVEVAKEEMHKFFPQMKRWRIKG